jgi:transcriptional regulator with XRE-family HTH domain
MTLSHNTIEDQSAAVVVAKAVFNAAHRLGLSQKDLSEILGLSQGQISKLKTGDAFFAKSQTPKFLQSLGPVQ